MPASPGLNALAARKQLLIAQADLHRQVIGLERLQLRTRAHAARVFLEQNRVWLVAGAALGGLLLSRRWRSLAGWVPPLLAVARAFKR